MDLSKWASQLGIPELEHEPMPLSKSKFDEIMRRLTPCAKEEKKPGAARQSADDAPGGNLWKAALDAPTPLHAAALYAHSTALTAATRAAAVRMALAKMIGLSLTAAVAGLTTSTGHDGDVCGLCTTANIVTSPWQDEDEELLRHVSACRKIGAHNDNRARHDALVRVAAGIARECGINAKAHDGPLFQFITRSGEGKKRPADWLERGGEKNPVDRAAYHSRCYDLTIRQGGFSVLKAAVKEKVSKYAKVLSHHPHYALTVVAVNHHGEYTKGTTDMLEQWAFHLAKLRRSEADLCGRPEQEVKAALGYGFALCMSQQLAVYMNSVSEKIAGRSTVNTRGVPSLSQARARWLKNCIPGRDELGASTRSTKRFRAAAGTGQLQPAGANSPHIFNDEDLADMGPSSDAPTLHAVVPSCFNNSQGGVT
jgi:hypothetical protein